MSVSLTLAAGCGGGDENNDDMDAGGQDTSADASDGGDVDADPGPQTISINHSFAMDEGGWESDVADFQTGNENGVAFRGELRELPAELNQAGTGYYLDALNPSSSIFAFIRKQLTEEDGIYANTEYQVSYRVEFATTYGSECPDTPGTSMYLKAGATKYKPAVIDGEVDDDPYQVLNYDKGDGELGGPAATALGDIAHDGSCDGFWVIQSLEGVHRTTVESAEDGTVWLLAGVDAEVSEALAIYIVRIEVTVEPIETE
ncbi:MAG: hypothetical protein ACQEVA_09105 [Myxococcota bacterium]